MRSLRLILQPPLIILLSSVCAPEQDDLLEDPSFELTKDKDQFGLVFAKWGGWKYEGDCEFAVGRVAHSGRSSCLLKAGAAPKIRVVQLRDLEPGRYQVTAWVRGLDIGVGLWNQTTEFMFDGKYGVFVNLDNPSGFWGEFRAYRRRATF